MTHCRLWILMLMLLFFCSVSALAGDDPAIPAAHGITNSREAVSDLEQSAAPEHNQRKSCAPLDHKGIEELTVYATLPYFKWTEMVDGSTFVKERGAQYGAGIMIRGNLNKTLTAQLKGEFFAGDVDYDGAIQYSDGSTTPFIGKTGYFGARMGLDLGRQFSLKNKTSIEPFFGLGYRWWQRELPSGKDVQGMEVPGYIEEWNTLYGRFGVRTGYSVRSRTKLYLELGGRGPLNNNYRLSNIADTGAMLLKSGKQLSVFGEIGARIGRFQMGFYYEGFRFSKSAIVEDSYQPQSDLNIFGLKLGLNLL
jgi:hypothetical protein